MAMCGWKENIFFPAKRNEKTATFDLKLCKIIRTDTKIPHFGIMLFISLIPKSFMNILFSAICNHFHVTWKTGSFWLLLLLLFIYFVFFFCIRVCFSSLFCSYPNTLISISVSITLIGHSICYSSSCSINQLIN